MMSANNDDDITGLGFEVVVEHQGNAAAFDVPDGWTYEEHVVNDVVVQAIAPNRAHTRALGFPIITFHDIAMNAPLCFSTFFSYCRTSGICPQLDAAYAHYHLTAPGHLPDAATAPTSTSFEIDALAKTVVEVIERFQLRRVIGIGFGVGSTILTQAALALPKVVAGLVLVCPLFYAATFIERAFTSVDAYYTRGVGLGRRTKDRFLERWLSQETRDSNFDLTQAVEDELDRLSTPNMARFVLAEVRRPDLAGKVGQLQSKVMLVTGKESPLRFHTDDAFSSFNPENVSWLDVADKGSFVLEEAPERVARGLSLYLQGFPEYTA